MVKRFVLLRKAHETRLLGCLALAVATPTLGVLVTLLVAAIPTLLAAWLAPHLLGLALGLSAAVWLVSAAAIAYGALRMARRAARLRLPSGAAVVGSDGVAVRRFLRSRFHPWSSVTSVRHDEEQRSVVLELAGGSEEVLAVADSHVLETAVGRARERYARGTRTERLRVLGCDDVPDADWLERARSAATDHAYRQEAVTRETLLAVALDAAQAPEQRVGAALALSAASEDVVRRVRVAVDDTANPELAEAMSAALDDELEPELVRRAVRARR